MVRREGTRFGVTTSQNVRRLPFPYHHIHAHQNVLVETKLDAGVTHAVKRQAKAAMKKQLEKGAFDSRDATSSKHVQYSLNKARRWEVIDDIVEEGENHSNRSIVVQHHALPRPRCSYSATRSCIKVFDSSVEEGKKLPKKKYARVKELMSNESEQEAAMEDEDFGKKNRRRSRKGKGVHHVEREEGESAPLTTVRYDVTLAAPRRTYQTYCNTVGDSDSGCGKRNRNSKNRTKKLAQCNMQDVFTDGFWELEADYLMEEEEEYWEEETKDADSYPNCQVAMETLVNKAYSTSPGVYHRDQAHSRSFQKEMVDTKARIFPLDEKDAIPYFTKPVDMDHVDKKIGKQRRRRRRKQEKAMIEKMVEIPTPTPVLVPEAEEFTSEKPSVVVSVKTDDITSIRLEGQLGSRYIEGLCMPRRFAISITDSIINQLQTSGSNGSVVSMLRQSGHHIFTIVDCALNPQQTMGRDDSLVEEVRVKVCGLKDDKEMLNNVVTNLDTNDFSQLVSAVTQSTAEMPLESYLTDSSATSVATKPALEVETVQSVLGWHYDVTSVNKATEKTLSSGKSINDCETGEVQSGASNACESCAICFQEFDETCPGTALISCSHWFCDECWKSHLISRVEQGDTNITCPGFGCTSAVDKVTLMSFLPSKLYVRHHANKANVALMLQQDLQWCPSPYCGRLLRLAMAGSGGRWAAVGKGRGVVPVNCECGMFWCSECKQEAHWPATCQQAELYRKEVKNVIVLKKIETMKVNAKRCPKCFYPIEKFYGCNHMMCKCGFEFCWECGKPFHGDHYYCVEKQTLSFKQYVIKPEECVDKSAIELAVLHHKKRTYAACHNRSRKARRLALKMAHPQMPASSSDSDSDDASSLKSSTTALNRLGHRGQNSNLQRVQKVLSGVASFLSEAEFVLEHLEILLSTASPSNQRRVLSQHKTRLIFITEHLHKILNEEAKLDIGKVEHMLHCGKSCLKLIAVTATRLTNSMSSGATEE